MENASDALIMAGSMFLLIIALTLSISSFTRVKTDVDNIVNSRTQIQYATGSDNQLLNFIKSSKYARTVQFESIVTTLRRLRKENYEVYIIFTNPTDISNLTSDIMKDNHLASAIKDELHKNEKFGDIDVTGGTTFIKFTLSGETNNYVEDKNSDNFDKALKILYNNIKDSKFKEYYGLYEEEKEEGVLESNQMKIVTYVQE